MRKTARIAPKRMPLLTASIIGPRRYFPAWIDSDDAAPKLALSGGVVLSRVRAALPLRRVLAAAVAKVTARKRKSPDAHRVR